MKLKLLLLMLFVSIGFANAQNTLNVHQKSGGIVSYSFKEKPVATFSGDNLVIKTTSVEINYPLSDLGQFTFEDGASGIETIKAIDVKSPVTNIYTINGVLVKTIKSNETLSLNDIPSGTYIIKNGTTTYKIIKR